MAETLDTLATKIDALGVAMNSGFEQIYGRFERVDQRFEQIGQRFERVDQRFKEIDQRFGQIDQRFEQIDQRLEQIDQRFEHVDGRLEQIDRRFEYVEQTFRTVFEQFDDLKTHLTIRIDVVDSKVGLLLERVDDFLKRDVANSAEHARMDTRIDAHDLRITALERGDRRKAH